MVFDYVEFQIFQYLQDPLFPYCVPDQELGLCFRGAVLSEDRFPVFEENFPFYALRRATELDGDSQRLIDDVAFQFFAEVHRPDLFQQRDDIGQSIRYIGLFDSDHI